MTHRFHLANRFYLTLAALMALVFTVSFFVARGRLNDAMGALKEKKAAYTEVSNAVAVLQDQLDYIQTDAYIERAARDELGLIYPGEYRYVDNQ